MTPHSIALIASILLLLPGIAMTFVPMLPALSYMFVIALVFGIVDGFATLSVWNLVALLCVTLVSIAVDHTAGLLGAKYGGAHLKSLGWGILGAFLGLFIFPAFGSFIGLFLAVAIAELYYTREHRAAVKAASGAVMGALVGVSVNVVLSLAFFTLFVFLALK